MTRDGFWFELELMRHELVTIIRSPFLSGTVKKETTMRSNTKAKPATKITRRQLLGTGAIAGASMTLAGMANAAPREMPESWDEEVHVVVVGSGFAGLAAAYEATKAGASVALLERMRTPGGNSIINGGVISAAGSPEQADQGIEDSPVVMYADMLKAGLGLNHPALAQKVPEESAATVQWTMMNSGSSTGV